MVLVGPPAAGKSTVGRLLAAELGAPFVDTDAEVALTAGKPVGDIFVADGEAAFRDLERIAAARALAAERAVVALGSGAVLDPDTRTLLGARRVVHLAAGFATVASRLGFDRPRVVIPGNPRGMLRTMLAQREPDYAALAARTVRADELAPEEIVADLAGWLAAGAPERRAAGGVGR